MEVLKKVSENFKNLDEKKRKFIIIIAIAIVAIIVITIATSIIFGLNSNTAGKVIGNLNNEGFAVGKGSKAYISNTLIDSGKKASEKGLYEITSKNESKLITTDEYVKSVDCNKRDYDSYYRIAELLNDLDKKDEAITMLQNLLQNKPEYYKASTLLGELLYSQERFKEAVTVYQDALKYKPADFELYYSLGMVYTRLNDFSSAKECYEKAAEINHRLYNSKYNLGQIALIEKDLEAAEEYFAECLMSEELEAKAYYQLAKIYMVKGEKDKAIVFANKAIEIDESYLKIISKENIFEPIKQYLTVKVKMEEKEVKKQNPKDLEIQNYLEETLYLIKDMNENEIKNRVSKHVDEIFEQEELKKMQEERLQEDENTEEKVK